MTDRVSLVVITDGRLNELTDTLHSFFSHHSDYLFLNKYIINDSRDPGFAIAVDNLCDHYRMIHIRPQSEKRGFAGAIVEAWNMADDGCDFLFHLEDDFVFIEPAPIDKMIDILTHHTYLAQIALKRQPWNPEEKKAGGIIEQWPDLYDEREYRGDYFTQHRLFYTTNPALVPKRTFSRKWPLVPRSEEVFSKMLFEDSEIRSAFWGRKFDPPHVHHIGNERVGTGY